MRVAHITSDLDPRSGGVVTAVIGLAQAQHDAGIEVSVVTTLRHGADHQMVNRLREADIDVEVIGPCVGPLAWHPSIGRAIARRARAVDVMHLHALWEQIHHSAARYCYRHSQPYLIAPHGMLDPWCLGQSRLKKQLYLSWRLRQNLSRATALHFTAETERRLTEPLGLATPTIVEPNGLDMSEFTDLPPAGSFRRRFAAVGDRPIVLFLSRLHPKKGLNLLIPAFARAETGAAVLVIAGPADDDYRGQVEAMIREQGLMDRAILTGMLYGSQRLEAMIDADLFVLPSYQENFGIVVAESLACGTPVIISDQVNICDEIMASSVGTVVPTQIQPLADAIGKWLHDVPLRNAAAARSRPFVEQRYDWRQIAGRWRDHYRRLTETEAT